MRSTLRRPGLAITIAVSVAVAACGTLPAPSPDPSTPASPLPSTTAVPPTPRPLPGHELYGFVPYWEMDDTIAAHLKQTPLTTLALFSVTATAAGELDATQAGYRRITGQVGRDLIRMAHSLGMRVDLTFSSFGLARNQALFSDQPAQDAVIRELVSLAGRLGVDGLDIDVESLNPVLVPAYGAFVGRARAALVAANPAGRVTVATTGHVIGAAMAEAAVAAGADRVFLMGYDYRISTDDPGAEAPIARRDGDDRSLPWSLDLYATLGVPVERTILGLPLYGMRWPVAGPVIGAPRTGPGQAWIPEHNLDVLTDARIVPLRDDIEQVEVYLFGSDGSTGAPSPGASPRPALPEVTWQAVYVDSPQTLAPKLALANDRGLAGAGFWAIGYERGLPGYADLMRRFVAGDALP